MYHFVPSHATTVVKYWRNVGRLSIDMSADKWTTTLGRHIDDHASLSSITAVQIYELFHIYFTSYRSSVGRHIDRYISGYVDRHISVDISVNSRPICRPTLDRYVDRYIGRESVDMSTDISVEGCTKYT